MASQETIMWILNLFQFKPFSGESIQPWVKFIYVHNHREINLSIGYSLFNKCPIISIKNLVYYIPETNQDSTLYETLLHIGLTDLDIKHNIYWLDNIIDKMYLTWNEQYTFEDMQNNITYDTYLYN